MANHFKHLLENLHRRYLINNCPVFAPIKTGRVERSVSADGGQSFINQAHFGLNSATGQRFCQVAGIITGHGG